MEIRISARTLGLALAASVLAGYGTAFSDGHIRDHVTDDGFERGFSKFYEADNRYAAVIEQSEEFFSNMDIAGAIESLDEDFTMYEITDDGPEARVQGIAQVREAVGGVFSSGKWLGANVYKWGLTDNTLVQIEEDFFSTDDGGKRSIKTLVVFEHRDGKRWREWRFKPQDK